MAYLQLPHLTPQWKKIAPIIESFEVTSISDYVIFVQKVANPAVDISEANLRGLICVLEECPEFLKTTLPIMRKTVLESPTLFSEPIPLLTPDSVDKEVKFSPDQAFCLLSMAFFCMTSPSGIDFNEFNFANSFIEMPSQLAKIRCWIEYFVIRSELQMRSNEAEDGDEFNEGEITIKRHSVPSDIDIVHEMNVNTQEEDYIGWPGVEIREEGGIEDAGEFALKADFANEYIGGGVLQLGRVQEEIRFTVAPELLCSMAVCSVMLKNEAILIHGAIDYTITAGYSRSLQYVGRSSTFTSVFPSESSSESTKLNDIATMLKKEREAELLVAFDAIPFAYGHDALQFEQRGIEREIIKAFAAFTADHGHTNVATGNWGCGAFGGHVQLKFLIQVIAATLARRPMLYYSFGNAGIRSPIIGKLLKKWQVERTSISDVFDLICAWGGDGDLFEYLLLVK